MGKFKVPLARNTAGILSTPEKAERGKDYFCPSCEEKVILRKGIKVRAHFAHGHTADCSQESIIHVTAKSMIVAEMNKNPREINFIRFCPQCAEKKQQPVPERVVYAKEEVASGPFRVDVGLFSREGLEAAVEVRVTHKVDERKKSELSIPFIEVDGETVILNPVELVAIFDTFLPWRCLACETASKDMVKRLMDLIKRVSDETRIAIPKFPYITGVQFCSNCDKRCLVFNTSNLSERELKDDQKRPRTLRYFRARKNGGFGWHNHCSRCGYLLNNGFLHSITDGGLAGSGSGDEAENYRAMAFYADYNGRLSD